MVGAIEHVWPSVPIYHCEHHLRERCYDKLRTVGMHQAGTPAFDAVERAFDNATAWDLLSHEWQATRRRELPNHIRRIEPLVLDQLARRPSYPTSRDPVTTGALDERLRWLRQRLAPRAGRLTNQERLNRALLLMMLDRNGFASEARYARTIHDWLLTGAGRPRVPRRAIADPTGYASLRP